MKWELHTHTAQGSACGHVPAEEVVARHWAAGFSGIVITDHYNHKNLVDRPGLPRDQALSWLGGYFSARAAGDRLGICVLFGLEVRLPGCDNDYLVYGAQPDMVLGYPGLHEMDIGGLYALVKCWGAVMIQAHPNRPSCHPVDRRYVDGYEVFNGNPRHENHNARSLALVRGAPGLIGISGSDYHQAEDLGRGSMATDAPIHTPGQLVNCLRRGALCPTWAGEREHGGEARIWQSI